MVLAYTLEAHASDTWPMKFEVEWRSPRTLQERAQHAIACAVDMDLIELDAAADEAAIKQQLRDTAGADVPVSVVPPPPAPGSSSSMEVDDSPPQAHVVVDHPDGDPFNTAFCAWPLAYYLIEADGTLAYIGACPEGTAWYDLKELTTFVEHWCRDKDKVVAGA